MNGKSFGFIRLCMLGISVISFLSAFYIYRFKMPRMRDKKSVDPTWKKYFLMLIVNGIFAAYTAALLPDFLNRSTTFSKVNYETGQVEELFTYKAKPNLHPRATGVIDLKHLGDLQSFQFSIGSFRGDPKLEGSIWKYDIPSGELTELMDSGSNDGFADFSADQSKMVFRSGRSGNLDIYFSENGETLNLTNSEARENFPVISPDGTMISYVSDKSGVTYNSEVKSVDLYVVERAADGSWGDAERLTTYEGQEGHAHFSPDGKWLIYSSEEFGISDEIPLVKHYIFAPQMYGEIAAMRLSDRSVHRLTHNKWEDGAPVWIKGSD